VSSDYKRLIQTENAERRLVFPDVFVPKCWVSDDEITHYFDKTWIVHDCYVTAMFLDPVLATLEVDVVAN